MHLAYYILEYIDNLLDITGILSFNEKKYHEIELIEKEEVANQIEYKKKEINNENKKGLNNELNKELKKLNKENKIKEKEKE